MAKYCTECGAQLPDDARFCSACGKAQTAANSPVGTADEPKWATCEITFAVVGEHWGIFPKDILQFQAVRQVGGAAQIVAESPKFKSGTTDYAQPREKSKRHAAVLNAFITELIKMGWQVLPQKGSEWYSYRFRREENPQD